MNLSDGLVVGETNELDNSLLAVVDETRTHFQLYNVPIEPTCSMWTASLMVEQMPAKGMVLKLSLTIINIYF